MRHDGLQKCSFVIRYLTLFGGEAGSKVGALLAFAYLARALGPRLAGATLACAAYALVTASQWDASRLRRAWEGR